MRVIEKWEWGNGSEEEMEERKKCKGVKNESGGCEREERKRNERAGERDTLWLCFFGREH